MALAPFRWRNLHGTKGKGPEGPLLDWLRLERRRVGARRWHGCGGFRL